MARIIALVPTAPLVETMRMVIVLGCALALILAEVAVPHF
jgi:hypothetical protein